MLDKLCYVGIGVGSFLIGVATGLSLVKRPCEYCIDDCDEHYDVYAEDCPEAYDGWVLNGDRFKEETFTATIEIPEKTQNLIKKEFDEFDERKERAAQVVAAKLSRGGSNEEKYEALKKAREEMSPFYEGMVDGIKKGKEEYNKLVDVYASEQDPEETGSIFVISQEEYNADEDYEKKDLVYFELDEVVSDDMDNVIHEWDDLIGKDALKKFGEKSGDDDIVYIRNHKLKSDYMLVRENQSYEENVLGYTKDSEKRVAEAREFFENMKKE